MSCCLITGAGGFLGQYLEREALSRGLRVVAPRDLWLPSGELAPLLRAERPSLVLHAAGSSSVAASFDDPGGDFQKSVLPLQCVLDACRRELPGARVVFLSSAAVYGDPRSLPILEASPLLPISPYGFHKCAAELLVAQYAALHRVQGASARVFSAYGPGLRRQVIFELFRRVRAGEPLRLDGTGDESRDFIHAADVARAAFAIADRGPCQGEAYNVASGVETTLRELASLVREIACPGQVVFSGQGRRGDPARWRADVSALAALGFAPGVSLREGLADVHRFCQGLDA